MIKKSISISLLAILMAFSPFSFSLDLQQAKSQGLVGEKLNGYLGSPSSGISAEVKSLIQDINSKRKRKYSEIAKKVGKSISMIEKLAGEKAQSKTKRGQYVQSSSGQWKKR